MGVSFRLPAGNYTELSARLVWLFAQSGRNERQWGEARGAGSRWMAGNCAGTRAAKRCGSEIGLKSNDLRKIWYKQRTR